MSKGGQKPGHKADQKAAAKTGTGPRTITSDEADLWSHATRTLAPIKAKSRVAAAKEPAPATPRPAPATPSQAPDRARKPAAPAPPRQRPAPALAPLDRRKTRQIASGKAEIDGRIDLHGLRQRDAHARLLAFLRDGHASGRRTVLVITGKGAVEDDSDHLSAAMGESRRGVLRRAVPLWLEEPEFRSLVVGYTVAGIRHGGEGALYVQLRKPARQDHER